MMMYLVVGAYRIPWSFRIYRGQGTASPTQLALKLLRRFPPALKQRYQVMVLADSGFGSRAFFQALRRLKFNALVAVSGRRRLADGRLLKHLYGAGQQVWLKDLSFPLTMGYYYFKGGDGLYRKRYLLCTRPLKASTLKWWGRRRWQIETFFKVIKHRFGLHRFGQCTQRGVYRWLILVLLAFILATWVHLGIQTGTTEVDWAQASEKTAKLLLSEVVIISLLSQLNRWREEAASLGIYIPDYW